ncbi:MAG: 2OG-Fe(II) oxygenase [Leptothrix sp. (in: b-proteobacteria)]
MTTQTATPELRQWILDQAKAGHQPDAVLKAMQTSGWSEDVALATLEETLESFLADHTGQLNAPNPVPEPHLDGSPSVVFAHDREVRVLLSMRNPRVVVFGGFMSDAECDELVALAQPRLARSETVDNSTGGSEVNEARTSQGMFFTRGEAGLLQRIEARIAALVNWPVENGEGVQVLHYRPGAEYKPHYDYFDPAQPGTPTILKRGGQRVGTLVMYLNTPVQGGGTTFPDVQLEVAPIKGNAVFFSYDRADPSSRSLHGGAPVLAGEKWVATKWMREGRFD